MKTIIKVSTLLLIMICFFSADAIAQPEAVPGKLPLYGQITLEGKKVKDGIIRIYEGNELWREMETEKKGHFSVGLDLNKYYTVEFITEGAVTKRITVNTELDKKSAKPVPFECYVDLASIEKFEGQDISNLDFPVAIISYNEKKRLFEPSLAYSMNMLREYDKLAAEGK